MSELRAKLDVLQFQSGGLLRPTNYAKEIIPSEEELLAMSDEAFARYMELTEELTGSKEREEMLESLRETAKTDESIADIPRRVGAMMKSNWMTLDPETEEAVWRFPGAPVPYEAVAYGDMSMEDWNAINEQIMSQNYPNIIDEILALPGIPGMLTTDPETGESLIPTPEFSKRAEERIGKLRESIREQEGLSPPEGMIDVGAEMTGIMLGQLPVPGPKGAKVKKPPPATGFHSAGRMAKKMAAFPFRAGMEFFNPTIVPRLSTYGMGAAFGTAVGMAEESSREENRLEEMSAVQVRRNELIHEENKEIFQVYWPEWTMDEKVAQMESEAGPLYWAYLSSEQQEEMMDEFEDRGMLVEE